MIELGFKMIVINWNKGLIFLVEINIGFRNELYRDWRAWYDLVEAFGDKSLFIQE